MPEWTREQKRERVRNRVRNAHVSEGYQYFPAKEDTSTVRWDDYLRVGIYVRVSSSDPSQTSSFELQQKYYDEFVSKHPHWILVKIYADEGKSGVTIEHREQFQEMMQDALDGKLDLIITKSISRFSRNTLVALESIKKLKAKRVGIYFESEGVYSLNEDSRMGLTFFCEIAEQESRIRSRSMETSLRMRLDHGLPLTPELLGFLKDEEGKLVINQETENIPKLMFYMYLYGYSTQQIADVLTRLSKKTYLGNMKWSSSGVASSLRNERYCGDVMTRKRYKIFAADVVDQKTFKNRGEKPQSYYRGDHDGIISRDDYIAVQRIMNNARYGGTSLLPDLRVIPEGLLKGFVIVHPKWGSFTKDDYIRACKSVGGDQETEKVITGEAGQFDLREFEIVDFKMFEDTQVPSISMQIKSIRFSASCIRKMACGQYVELLVHPIKRKLAIRPTTKDNRYAIVWTKGSKGLPRDIACKAYIDNLFDIFGWRKDYRYRLYGCVYRDGEELACIFSDIDASVYIRKDDYLSASGVDAKGLLLDTSGKRIKAVTGDLGNRFGRSFYEEWNRDGHMTKEQWQTRIEARLCESGERLKITPYSELEAFIRQELGDLFEEVKP